MHGRAASGQREDAVEKGVIPPVIQMTDVFILTYAVLQPDKKADTLAAEDSS